MPGNFPDNGSLKAYSIRLTRWHQNRCECGQFKFYPNFGLGHGENNA